MTQGRSHITGAGRNFLTSAAGAVLLLAATLGCSVYMASNQPGKKDASILLAGTPRGHVIAELGRPSWTEEKNGEKVDLFKYKEGYSSGAKVARAMFHGVADLLTFGLWEVVGTPAEAYFSGTDVAVKVTYDENERVKTSEMLTGATPSEEKTDHDEGLEEELY